MNIKQILTGIAIATACLVHAADKQPNILWIITDDHRADSIQAYNQATRGQKYNELGYCMSPNADKLASEGVLFTEAYCNSPGCAPSRTSMQYGLYPHHSGHFGFEHSHQSADFVKPVLPNLLEEQGYQTTLFGKVGYYIYKREGNRFVPPHFHDVEVSMRDIFNNKRGDWSKNPRFENKKKAADITTWNFPDESIDIEIPTKGELSAEMKETRRDLRERLDILNPYKGEESTMVIGGVSPAATHQTIDGIISTALVDYLSNPGKPYTTPWGDTVPGPTFDKPLFTNLSFHFPHTPILPSKEFRDLFIAKEKEIPYKIPEFSKEELKKLPPQMKRWFEKMNFADLPKEGKLQTIRDYYAFCAMGDQLVGESVDAFKEYSRKSGRDWLILYVIGDHGWHLGEQGGESKFAPYETSNHCAVIAVSSDKKKWPAGKVCRDWIEYVDFSPTLLRAAGADLSGSRLAHLDGFPLEDTLSGKVKRAYTLGEFNHVIGPRAYMRSKEFAFSMRNRETNGKPGEKWGQKPGEDIQWGLTAPRDDVEMMLFDLRVDPKEQNNVADDPRYAKLADWFRVKLANITLGDGRMECDWSQENEYVLCNFAEGAHDRKLDIPANLIPKK